MLRKVRNEFAHNPFIKGFEDSKVERHLVALRALYSDVDPSLWRTFSKHGGEYIEFSNRNLFYIRAVFVCQQMIREVMSAPIAIRMGMAPFRALGRYEGTKDKPQILDGILNSALDVIEDCVQNETNAVERLG